MGVTTMQLRRSERLLIEAVRYKTRQVQAQVQPLVPHEDRVRNSSVGLRTNYVPNCVCEDDSLFKLIKCQIYLRLHFACRERISQK
jgi:hypothetical protein